MDVYYTQKGSLRVRVHKELGSIELFGQPDKDRLSVIIHQSAVQEFPLAFTFEHIDELEKMIETFKKKKDEQRSKGDCSDREEARVYDNPS